MKFLVAAGYIFVQAGYAMASYSRQQHGYVTSHLISNPLPREVEAVVENHLRKASVLTASRFPFQSHEAFSRGSSSHEYLCREWSDELTRVPDRKSAGQMALLFLKAIDARWNCASGKPADEGCKWMNIVRAGLGGSLDPRVTKPISISETISYSGLPNEKRITATILLDPGKRLGKSLSVMFEDFLIRQSRDKTTARLFNSIRVNERKEVLGISASGGLQDVYAFSHCNDETNSIWIVLYVGRTQTLEYGRALIDTFIGELKSAHFTITDKIVITSEEEAALEREAEKQTETDRIYEMESGATFALNLLCDS